MKERIIEFLRAEKKTSAQLAGELRVQPSGISHIISGRNKPSLDFILKMLERYEFLSGDWLLFGKGSMYKEAGMQNLVDGTIDFNENISESRQPAEENIKIKEEKDNDVSNVNKITGSTAERKIERIIMFYSDRSFTEYRQEGE